MTKTNLITAGLAGCLLLVSCEPLPVPPPRYYGPYGELRPAPGPDDRTNPGREQPPQPPQPEQQRPPVSNGYPVAERTDNLNQVLSPYSPYNVIDVEGIRSGQLAKDPSNGKIFRVP